MIKKTAKKIADWRKESIQRHIERGRSILLEDDQDKRELDFVSPAYRRVNLY